MYVRSFRVLYVLSSIVVLIGCGARSPGDTPSTTPSTTASEEVPASTPALAEAARTLAGRWRCRGSVVGPEGPSASVVVVDAELDLGGTWIQTRFSVESGRYPYEFTAYRTFDTTSGSWVSLIVDNLGGHTVSRSTDGVAWTGSSRTPMGELPIRDTETLLASDRMHMLGQYSTDGGASWSTGYDLSCER